MKIICPVSYKTFGGVCSVPWTVFTLFWYRIKNCSPFFLTMAQYFHEPTVPPMSIMLMGVDGPISAGVGVTLVCVVVGARPTPTVSWFLDGRPLASRDNMMHSTNNKTESHLVLVATPEDQGRYLSCRAETPGLLQSSLEDGTKLVVHCKSVRNLPWIYELWCLY